ncbi:Histone-lysine N-methyltransferase EZH2 [Purpureocillium lavendulum]|uniref:Histone-lysine N-methyltransferase EZH2 n=1 Tax=Purpureocillium lavendulum TaxID=1247861 RepID=A0AB34FXA0_9HYPO|nr:Histone-lysine N-methyltransferase EZH2 [Purpureocillium lavendulum]
MASAPQAVLSTAELLEAILLDVDMRTLLVSAPRVCRRWHAVVASSPALQRALFLHPEDGDGSQDGDRSCIPEKRQNPLLKDLFPAWFECTPSFRPDVAEPLHRFPATVTMGYKRFQELPLYDASLNVRASGGDNPFLRPRASWRRMLTSQPPCRVVVASASRAPGASLSKTLGQPRLLRYPDGLRMGALYDMTLRHCSTQTRGGNGGSGFMVVWVQGEGDEGYIDLARHLRRMVGVLPVVFEMGFRLVWEKRPDLVVQMLHTARGASEFEEGLGRFWELCGAGVLGGGVPGVPDLKADSGGRRGDRDFDIDWTIAE